ncbi:MAG: hypothetical protein QOJ19_1544 [Acidimicrobiia bacterium]|nr:hypothetical protein [Acidimicrobiia bacterium]
MAGLRSMRPGRRPIAIGVLVVAALIAVVLIATRDHGGQGATSPASTAPPGAGSKPTDPSVVLPTVPPQTPSTASTVLPSPGRFPDATTTGVPPGTKLTPFPQTGYVELDHDLDGVDFTGVLVIKKPGITIRNSRINADTFLAGIFNPDGHADVVVDHVDIVCTATDPPTGAGVVNVAVLTNTDISGCVDGVKAAAGSRIEGNYIHNLGFGPDTHNDGVQLEGGTDIVIQGNTIVQRDNGKRQANSAVFVQDTTEEVRRVVIRSNYLDGFGFTVRLTGERIADTHVVGNVIGVDRLFAPVGVDGGAEERIKGNVVSDNVNPDGTPIS